MEGQSQDHWNLEEEETYGQGGRIPSNRGWNQILEMVDKETTQKSGAEIGIPDGEDRMSKGERDEK